MTIGTDILHGMNRFENKVALVTGAGSGIGRATAVRLAEEGAGVFLADIDADSLAETAQLLPAGIPAASACLDVADQQQCAATVEQCVAEMGRLDVLCNIAGIAMLRHFTDITPAEWHRVVDVNLNGTFYLCQAAMPHLLETGGNIVNMSSSAGRGGQAYNAAYCAAKAGLLMMTKALAVEYAAKGVRANAVCPGAVDTPLSRNFTPPPDIDQALFNRLISPVQPWAEPEEIAAAIAYLASDEARFVTGIDFAIDGGQTAG